MQYTTLKFSEVNPQKLSVKPFKNLQLIQYYDDLVIVQSPWIQLTHYGIPTLNKYNATEESRRYLRVPLGDDDFSKFR